MSSGRRLRNVDAVGTVHSPRLGRSHRRRRCAVSVLGVTLFLGALGCFPVVPPQRVNEEWTEVLQKRHASYQFKPGDVISVEFEGVEEGSPMNQLDLTVLPDGTVDLFRVDNYKIAGQTIAEFQRYVEERVAEQVGDREARIKVTPAEEYIYMSGQWERLPAPERIVLTPKMTLQEAVSYMNWMRLTGDTDYALLRRPYSDPLHPRFYRVDLNDWTEDIYLLPNDAVHLQRTFLAAVVHYMREYVFGVFPVSGLSAALIASGA